MFFKFKKLNFMIMDKIILILIAILLINIVVYIIVYHVHAQL
jgi:hypothetical protein